MFLRHRDLKCIFLMYSVPIWIHITSTRHKESRKCDIAVWLMLANVNSPYWKRRPVAGYLNWDLLLLIKCFVICCEGSSNRQTYRKILRSIRHFPRWDVECLTENSHYTFQLEWCVDLTEDGFFGWDGNRVWACIVSNR